MAKRKRGKARKTPVTGFARQLDRPHAVSNLRDIAQTNPNAMNAVRLALPPTFTHALTTPLLETSRTNGRELYQSGTSWTPEVRTRGRFLQPSTYRNPALPCPHVIPSAAVDVSGIGSPDWCRPEAEADACLAAPEPRRIQPPARTAHNGTGPPEGRCQGHSITGDRPETPGRLQGGLDLGLILNQLACSPPHPSTPCAVLFFGVSDARWCLSSDAVPDSHVSGHGRGGAALVPGGWRQPVRG